MSTYAYTIFDSDPISNPDSEWPRRKDVKIEADSDEKALTEVSEILGIEASGLSREDGYEIGQRLYAMVWNTSVHQFWTIVGLLTYDLTVEELGEDPEREDREAVT